MTQRGGTLLPSTAVGPPREGAWPAATRAIRRAGVQVTAPLRLPDLEAASALWQRVWSPDGEPLVPTEMLRALTHAGNYLGVAHADGHVAGALLGFFGAEGEGASVDRLHSHILGVDARDRGRGVGYALKLHQRAWALDRGVQVMTWTFDPLVRRNGHFNLVKLGAEGVDYLVDFYGPMPDAINGGDSTDRILVSWNLLDTTCEAPPPARDVDEWLQRGAVIALGTAADGRPLCCDVPADAPAVLCATPPDIVELRRSDAACAQQWRLAVRETMRAALRSGMRLVDMARGGWYVLAGDEL
jgi:predicted GNAT superfamily acetyltransferase